MMYMNQQNSQRKIEIKSFGGRLLESRKPRPDKTGFIGAINVLPLNKNGNIVEAAQPDFTGKSFLFSDSTGNTFLAHLNHNRFSTIARNLRASCLQFLDHNFITFAIASKDRDVFVYNNSGKLVESLKGHQSVVFDIQVNFVKETFFTVSKDCVILWNLKTFRKVRTLLPKRDGNKASGRKLKFSSAQFTSDSDFLMTRFDNGICYFWNLTTYEMEKEIAFGKEYSLCHLMTDNDSLVRAGKLDSFDHLLQSRSELRTLGLPYGNKRVRKIDSLNSSNVLIFLCGDHRIFFIDPDRNYSVIHEIRGRHKGFSNFYLDKMRETIACITTEGELYLYNIPMMLKSTLEAMKLRMGSGDPLEKIQTVLDMRERMPFEVKVSPKQLGVREPFNIITPDVIDSMKDLIMLRDNRVHYQGQSNFDLLNLRVFLKKNKGFPDKYRSVIWTYLLDLPQNFVLYNDYIQKGLNKKIEENFSDKFPLKSKKLSQKMIRVLSVLSNYCPLFGDLELVPSLVFPLVKLFSKDECLGLEVSLSFFLHWGQHLFEDYPNPPASVMIFLEKLLKFHDFELHNHLRNLGCTVANIVWPSMKNLYTDVLTKPQWLRLWDTLVAYPEYLELFHILILAEIVVRRSQMLEFKDSNSLIKFLGNFSVDNIGKTLQMAVKMLSGVLEITKNGEIKDDTPTLVFRTIIPLRKDCYQPFVFLPKNLL